MIQFAWPLVFLCLPLPWLVRRLFRPLDQKRDAALRVPNLSQFQVAIESYSGEHESKRPWYFWLAVLCWCLLVTATARPQWLGEAIELPVSGRDLLLAVDLSESMARMDFRINGAPVDRLVATKYVASQFIERRVGDRLGLILFGEQAFLQAPLTFDRETVKTLLQETVIGLAGRRTAIGDAIGLGIKRLVKQKEKNQKENELVMILMTDGENTAGEMKPIQAAEIARDLGIKIHTIGIGHVDKMQKNFRTMRRMGVVPNELDQQTLEKVAEMTGGRNFQAENTEQMEEIYELLDKLEPTEREQQYFRPVIPLYAWPLAGALLLGLLVLLVSHRGRTALSL